MSNEQRVAVKLKKPITFGERVVEELKLREPKFKDLKGITLVVGADGGLTLNCDDLLKLASRCSGELDTVIGELNFADLKEVGATILTFIGVSLPTGLSA